LNRPDHPNRDQQHAKENQKNAGLRSQKTLEETPHIFIRLSRRSVLIPVYSGCHYDSEDRVGTAEQSAVGDSHIRLLDYPGLTDDPEVILNWR
jgi:hypothetical protein